MCAGLCGCVRRRAAGRWRENEKDFSKSSHDTNTSLKPCIDVILPFITCIPSCVCVFVCVCEREKRFYMNPYITKCVVAHT